MDQGVGKKALATKYTSSARWIVKPDADQFSCPFYNVLVLGDGRQWESHVFIIVYSVTSRESFNRIAQYRESRTRAVGGTHAMVTIVGNKRDLDTEREVLTLEGQMLARELNCWFAETSARKGDNVERLYENGIQYLRWKSTKVQQPMPMEKELDRREKTV
ncbi:hypothetical protein D9613_008989 [Agrocybe pediades]|uniref:small monomeric GTPase n=1 Tax=Agrocybe pediades TaxID=84607 RepID=A0A8H4R2L5_9AGAR|nr:hypothetical protein D9613_008989 [Agrocybe pediades]